MDGLVNGWTDGWTKSGNEEAYTGSIEYFIQKNNASWIALKTNVKERGFNKLFLLINLLQYG